MLRRVFPSSVAQTSAVEPVGVPDRALDPGGQERVCEPITLGCRALEELTRSKCLKRALHGGRRPEPVTRPVPLRLDEPAVDGERAGEQSLMLGETLPERGVACVLGCEEPPERSGDLGVARRPARRDRRPDVEAELLRVL